MLKSFPTYIQHDAMDCGPTCLRIVAKHYGKEFTLQSLRDKSFITREGVSLLGISEAAEKVGFRTLRVSISYEKLEKEAHLPCIVYWEQKHFIVVYKIKKDKVYVSDPAHGLVTYSRKEFLKGWIANKEEGEEKGIALLIEPTPSFFQQDDEKIALKGFQLLFSYLFSYKKLLTQLILGMLLGSLLQLIFPFLTQSVVDFGINYRDVNFIYLILIAQLMLFFSRVTVDFIRSWILLFMSTRINISLISDFLIKLMKLPIAFFDTKMLGDLLQRINDHHRIEMFLTATTLNILFASFNLVIFGFVLAFYDVTILVIFLAGSVLYTLWLLFFLSRRRVLDYKRFNQMKENQNNLIQLITGMQEIKLHNSERLKRWQWERIQAKVFKISMDGLRLEQLQQAGAVFINELKNIIITFLAAKAVIDGDMTLGMMLAVQYILGQLNAPLEQMIGFLHTAQDAKISLERISEIHEAEEEEVDEDQKIFELPKDTSININNLSFQYEGPHSELVLKDINLIIPEGKITAIVGTSGSGKTTLIKMLLKFYEPKHGEIKVGNYNLVNISQHMWRDRCGAVMQNGFIFSDAIANNIAVGDEVVNKEKLFKAVDIANIREFIETLPLGYNTKLGIDGHGLSEGQKQRILIARAVYKDPKLLFFDEATNALDANNEKAIMENLNEFFIGRTVVVVAHRLSTVKNADQIIVLEKGDLVEKGTHAELVKSKGYYFNLVKNQLELGQ
ncbi:MAG: ABC transporter ATP-binding protein [Bacteroidetes bacterium]|nr:MAG: ABC transporter ATP-binding protein [Bacteroidota bacterium]